METQTLFRAYDRAYREREHARQRRPQGSHCIAVADDDWARRWQRYDRLITKLERRINARLDAADALIEITPQLLAVIDTLTTRYISLCSTYGIEPDFPPTVNTVREAARGILRRWQEAR